MILYNGTVATNIDDKSIDICIDSAKQKLSYITFSFNEKTSYEEPDHVLPQLGAIIEVKFIKDENDDYPSAYYRGVITEIKVRAGNKDGESLFDCIVLNSDAIGL